MESCSKKNVSNRWDKLSIFCHFLFSMVLDPIISTILQGSRPDQCAKVSPGQVDSADRGTLAPVIVTSAVT